MRDLLLVRIEALKRNLSRVHQDSYWKERLELASQLEEDDLWQAAFAEIHPRTKQALRKLDTIVDGARAGTLSPEDAWAAYRDVHGTSEALFRECLELQGGLAMRDRLLDEQICHVADELIRECARSMGQRSALSIPSHEAARTTTLSRIARVRFPEWDVWTLPLVAHEYGRVAIADHRDLRDYVAEVTGQWCAPDDRAVSVLLADAFATYTTGPAYACALILLRLSPFDGHVRTRRFDCQRARTVLAVLDAMERDKPYRVVCDRLTEYWDQAIVTTRSAGSAESATDAYDLDMRGLIELFEICFRPVVSYTMTEWALAMTWSGGWRERVDEGPLTVPGNLAVTYRLRDALNAAWHARIQLPELAPRLATVTRETCGEIIALRRNPKGPGGGRIPPASGPTR